MILDPQVVVNGQPLTSKVLDVVLRTLLLVQLVEPPKTTDSDSGRGSTVRDRPIKHFHKSTNGHQNQSSFSASSTPPPSTLGLKRLQLVMPKPLYKLLAGELGEPTVREPCEAPRAVDHLLAPRRGPGGGGAGGGGPAASDARGWGLGPG